LGHSSSPPYLRRGLLFSTAEALLAIVDGLERLPGRSVTIDGEAALARLTTA
jgi:hypothetical protein